MIFGASYKVLIDLMLKASLFCIKGGLIPSFQGVK